MNWGTPNEGFAALGQTSPARWRQIVHRFWVRQFVGQKLASKSVASVEGWLLVDDATSDVVTRALDSGTSPAWSFLVLVATTWIPCSSWLIRSVPNWQLLTRHGRGVAVFWGTCEQSDRLAAFMTAVPRATRAGEIGWALE